MENFNNLSPAETERLAWLAEEMGEVQQAIGKILRHGYESKNPNDANHKGNRADLERELSDVLKILLLMNNNSDIDLNKIYHIGMESIASSNRYLHHQEENKEMRKLKCRY